MASAEIDLKALKNAVNAVLEHLIVDLGIDKVAIEERQDYYWSCPPVEMYNTSKKPSEWWTGRLSDDMDFTKLSSAASLEIFPTI